MRQESINKYFDSTCRIIIDEFNFIFNGMTTEEKINYGNDKFCEADLVFRLGTPFRHMARYTIQGARGKDIIVDYNDFQVEVKYWRNWASKNSRTKAKWDENFENAMFWLCEEIKNGNKGKRAFIAGWCTVFKWNKLLQLGATPGSKPIVNKDRLQMLPFLTDTNSKVDGVKTNYSLKESKFHIAGREENIDWCLLGNESDNFNMVMYW